LTFLNVQKLLINTKVMNKTSKIKISSASFWIALLKGIILVIFGIWLLKSPMESLAKLSLIFGIIIIIGGLLEVGLAFNNRNTNKSWEWTLTSGILDILLGAFLVANPRFILILITVLVSIWLLIRGIIMIRYAFIIKKSNNPNYIYGLIFGIVLILLAAIFVWHPEVLGITVVFWTALAFISLGIFRIVFVFNIPRVTN
jgi:uncharacterized membrane protein HdeD (DUF308 family)